MLAVDDQPCVNAGTSDILSRHPRNDNTCFTKNTSEDRLRPVFENVKAHIVVCGHTHMQYDRAVGAMRVVNAGSVGMPFGRTGADWIVIGDEVEHAHTDYALETAAERIRSSAHPQADELAVRSVLDPPSEQEMLTRFAEVEPA